jgi:hypothetical protein
MANTTKLSPYTLARNCTDLADVNEGIKELASYFKNCEKTGKQPTTTAYVRYSKLILKKEKLNKKVK